MNVAAKIAYPEWTEYRKKEGLDPLGMQNTSVVLYQRLLPGISNVTQRIRYYGFYAWLLWTYANQQLGDTNPESWKRFIRRAEALYALASHWNKDRAGVAGIQWAARKLSPTARTGKNIAFAEDAEPGSSTHYLRQAWGAYGAAYASQLFEIGIFADVSAHGLPVPSAQIGEALARNVESEFGGLGGKFIEVHQRGIVTEDELASFGPLTPSRIREQSEERNLYQRLLFADAGLSRPQDIDRRKTLLLLLNLSQQFGYAPDVDEVRWAFYAGQLPDGTPLNLSNSELLLQRQRWWIYQANDLAHICFEALLKFILDQLSQHRDGVALATLIGNAVGEIKLAAEGLPSTWAALLSQTKPTENASSADDDASERRLCEEVLRAARQSDESICTPAGAWAALRLLATVQNRVRSGADKITHEFGAFDPNAFRSILTEMRFLDAHLNEPLEILIGRLLEERVIRRHLQIALRKLRFQNDYTFLIETDDGRVRLREKDGPVFTNPRLAPTLTFLKDIHLVSATGLTALGQAQAEAGA